MSYTAYKNMTNGEITPLAYADDPKNFSWLLPDKKEGEDYEVTANHIVSVGNRFWLDDSSPGYIIAKTAAENEAKRNSVVQEYLRNQASLIQAFNIALMRGDVETQTEIRFNLEQLDQEFDNQLKDVTNG